mgnify:CR=1 FL=1|tara:strand:- start:1949 stop:2479 length:531 start_codon:yes stop_codon:yes gene_type:complete
MNKNLNSILVNSFSYFKDEKLKSQLFMASVISREKLLDEINGKNDKSDFNPFLRKIIGVYVFVHKKYGVIYIGSSGKFNKLDNKTNVKVNGIGNRILESYTPYSVIDFRLCYKKKKNTNQKKILENYHNTYLKLKDVSIYIIDLSTTLIPPTVLEHLMLYEYLKLDTKIPIINQQI